MAPACLWPSIRRAGLLGRPLGVLLGLLLLLVDCNQSGNQGHLTPQASPAPAVERQAVDNLLSLYRTALRQADSDRVDALLASAEAVGAPHAQRQAVAGTVTDVAALRATLFRAIAVADGGEQTLDAVVLVPQAPAVSIDPVQGGHVTFPAVPGPLSTCRRAPCGFLWGARRPCA